MKPELIVALDVPEVAQLAPMVDRLPSAVEWYKVGLELFCAEGPAALLPLKERGKKIFLDLKLHDIPRTVARAVKSAAKHGARMITLHATGGHAMMEAAVAAAKECGESAPKLLAVTVLTSLDMKDLHAVGILRAPAAQAQVLAEMAMAAGVDGVVCSAQEASALRRKLGPKAWIVTPGIRPAAASEAGDQKRIATPAFAAKAGASHIVVGRPILEAADPGAAAKGILDELAAADTPPAPAPEIAPPPAAAQ